LSSWDRAGCRTRLLPLDLLEGPSAEDVRAAVEATQALGGRAPRPRGEDSW
jgi:hypothetical protein